MRCILAMHSCAVSCVCLRTSDLIFSGAWHVPPSTSTVQLNRTVVVAAVHVLQHSVLECIIAQLNRAQQRVQLHTHAREHCKR